MIELEIRRILYLTDWSQSLGSTFLSELGVDAIRFFTPKNTACFITFFLGKNQKNTLFDVHHCGFGRQMPM